MKIYFIFFVVFISQFSFAKTSQENRSDKKVEAAVHLGFEYRMTTTQISSSYFIDSNNLIGLKFGQESYNEERQTNFSVLYKHYVGNSFYVAGDFFYLKTKEDVNNTLDRFFMPVDFAHYESLGAGVKIGNQWTWKNFTLGCDWFGFGRRFVTFKKESSDLSRTTMTLLNLSLGASF